MLTKMGVEHTLVARGDEAVAAVSQTQFDIVLLDEKLAGETGAEVSARLRQACGDKPLRIVGVSGGRLGPGPGTGHYDGLDAKPARPEQLEELLTRWM
jgi:CheY-like chemotaxis protein